MTATGNQREGDTASAQLLAQLVTEIENEREFALQLRRELHQHPRLSGDEADSRDRIARATELDFTPVAETGGYCRFGPADGPAVAIRGELDALPVSEQTGLSWAATNGAMHACGHDVHMAALATFVRAAKRVTLPYAVVPLLQPREEAYPSGASDICDSGVLDTLNVAHVIGAHVHPRVLAGQVATGAGAVNAASGEIRIEVEGRTGHGAYPHDAADVASALAAIALGLPEVLRRTVNPLFPALLSVGRMVADSGAANVLPGKGTLHAMLRTTQNEDAAVIGDAVAEFARHQAEAYGVTAATTVVQGEPVLFNDAALCDALESRLPEAELAVAPAMRSLGADDFSFYSQQYPSTMSFVGVATPDTVEDGPSLHDATFLPDDDAVLRVAKTMACGYVAAVQQIQKR